jgi:hypothetical protein
VTYEQVQAELARKYPKRRTTEQQRLFGELVQLTYCARRYAHDSQHGPSFAEKARVTEEALKRASMSAKEKERALAVKLNPKNAFEECKRVQERLIAKYACATPAECRIAGLIAAAVVGHEFGVTDEARKKALDESLKLTDELRLVIRERKERERKEKLMEPVDPSRR